MFLWGYALETAAYILNHVPKITQELWSGYNPTLNHFQIWGCPANVVKGKMSKLETRSEICYFISCPKGTYSWYFYDPREQKVFISTNAIVLEDDNIMNHKPKGMIVLEKVRGEPSDFPIVNSNMEQEKYYNFTYLCTSTSS